MIVVIEVKEHGEGLILIHFANPFRFCFLKTKTKRTHLERLAYNS